MQTPKLSIFRIFTRAARPWMLAAVTLFYLLGLGTAVYLGELIRWQIAATGWGAAVFLMVSSFWLKAYFDRLADPLGKRSGENAPEQRLEPGLWLQMAVTALAAGAALTVALIFQGALSLTGWLVLGLAFALAFFYAVPPLRLSETAWGEMAQALLAANLIPALAFVLQVGEIHRLIAMLTFSLTAWTLAAFLALGLKDYARDLKWGRKTLLLTLGWQRGMVLHNVLIMSGYLLLVTASAVGLPWRLTWPVLLTLPLGLFEIWQVVQINNGAKPRWPLLDLTARGLVGISAYLLAISVWLG